MSLPWSRALACLLAACFGALAPSLALPPDTVSWTARIVCEYRAIAAQHPDPLLRNRDTLAARMCEPVLLPRQYDAAHDVIDTDPEKYAGYFFVNARTQHIDRVLARAAAAGVVQVVVLGAGFDSRAYRFHERYPKIVFFEVDAPATIAEKQRTVSRLLGAIPAHVRYAPVDFDEKNLAGALSGAGYDPGRKTLFILEGVTMYVGEAGNDATFAFMRDHSAPGSVVVYDYILRRVVDGDYAGLYAASSSAKGVASLGEPYVTGWTPAQAADFARRHRMTVLEDLDARELTRRYLTGSDGRPDGRMPEWHRIIDARIR